MSISRQSIILKVDKNKVTGHIRSDTKSASVLASWSPQMQIDGKSIKARRKSEKYSRHPIQDDHSVMSLD